MSTYAAFERFMDRSMLLGADWRAEEHSARLTDLREAFESGLAVRADMLAALKETRNTLALRGHRTKEQERLLGMVRAAIAKAEGYPKC